MKAPSKTLKTNIAKNITHGKNKLSLWFILENSLKEFYLIKWPYGNQEPTDRNGSKTLDHSFGQMTVGKFLWTNDYYFIS